jgi:hypothetical protein
MRTKEGVFGKPTVFSLEGEPLMRAIRLKQAQELKEGRIVHLSEIVRRAVNALYRSEIGEKDMKT